MLHRDLQINKKQLLALDLPKLLQCFYQASLNRLLDKDEITHILKLCDALWLHSGDPKHPHAELTSGKCSNGFVDVLRMLKYTQLCSLMANQMVNKFRSGYPDLHIDWVIGSDHAGAAISQAVATILGAQYDFAEKDPSGSKKQIWKRFKIQPEETVLQVEELVTTTGTLEAVRSGILDYHDYKIKFAPAVITLVHRSSAYEFNGSPILHLVHYDIQTWEPADCPLCAQGSKRLRPKQNWVELTAPDSGGGL